jgi:ferredoxin
LNNVGTLCNVPLVIRKGAAWWSSIGSESTRGTKVFSLTGKINHTGLIEVPMGISLREIVYDIGGGIPDGKAYKAVQLGGPSGGCVPSEYLDIPIDYESLKGINCIMGSGAMVVLDEEACMVDTARFFLEFDKDESCGQCTPCRRGLPIMIDILNRICEGNGEMEDIATLQELATTMQRTSLCALGQTAAGPTLSTLQHFREEYVAHIESKECPAGVCPALISYHIDPEQCKACMQCLKSCPVQAIDGGKNLIHVIDQEKCIRCGACAYVCPFDVVEKIPGLDVPQPPPEEKRTIVRKKKQADVSSEKMQGGH